MLRGRRTALATALALAAATAVMAGCGGGSGHALALDPVAAAATKTQNAGAARVRFAMAIGAQGKTVHLRGAGVIDGTSAEMSFRLGSLLGLAGGLPSAAKAQLGHGSLHEIVLEQDGDYVIYVRLGALASQLPGGKPWMKLDFSKLGKAAGVDLSKIMAGSQLQPTDLLSILKAEGAQVRKVGSATIDGTATTRYHVTVDLAKAFQSKGLTSPLLSSIAAQMKTISENVWIGRDGLVRRIALAYTLPVGSSPRLAMTMDLSDYGAHVRIAAPPSSEVFDATQLAQSGIGG